MPSRLVHCIRWFAGAWPTLGGKNERLADDCCDLVGYRVLVDLGACNMRAGRAGAWASALAQRWKMTRWIGIGDRLPKWGELVLVAHKQYEWSNTSHRYRKLKRLGVQPATYWQEDEAGPRFTLPDGDVVGDPVAWMPLPAPPTDAK